MINSNYWQTEGATKTFTHDLLHDWINQIPIDSKILDFGCGYGRIARQLYEIGYKNIIAYDPSPTMISRAENENPGPIYTIEKEIVFRHNYSLVLCFALFTSCPERKEQIEIKNIIEQQSESASYLYISDYYISDNPHYSGRYMQKLLGIYGCFGSDKAAIFRHHEDRHFDKLFEGWNRINERTVNGKTLNGNPINITQLLYKKY